MTVIDATRASAVYHCHSVCVVWGGRGVASMFSQDEYVGLHYM
jgi:hypothetical protein